MVANTVGVLTTTAPDPPEGATYRRHSEPPGKLPTCVHQARDGLCTSSYPPPSTVYPRACIHTRYATPRRR